MFLATLRVNLVYRQLANTLAALLDLQLDLQIITGFHLKNSTFHKAL